MAVNQEYWVGGEKGVISNIGDARANATMEGEIGRAARNYIAQWDKEQQGKRMAYGVSVDDYTDPLGRVDTAAYRKAQLAWMSGNSAFQGWTEADMTGFLDEMQANNWNEKQRTAAQLWYSTGIAQRNANEQKAKDRADMLAEIEAYKAGFSNEAIQTALAAERQAWDTKIEQTMNQAMNQAAAQGRVMDGSTYAMLRGRLEAQAAAAMQKVQNDYEQQRQEYAYRALSAKGDVYKNTTNTVMDYSDVANIIKAMAGQK